MSTLKRSAAILASGLIAGGVLVGCSPAVQGGDTTCKDYKAADDKTQNDAVAKMLKDEKGADATQAEISLSKAAVATWCGTLGTPDAKIKESPHT